MTDPFEVLGLSAGATADEVRTAFWQRAREMHPDRHPDDPHANERFRRVVLAYEDALRTARGLPPRRRGATHVTPARHAAPPPKWRCPSCGDGWDVEDSCPRCEVVVALAPAPPSAHVLGGAAMIAGAFVLAAGVQPVAIGGMLVLFGAFVLGLVLHERLRPALPLA